MEFRNLNTFKSVAEHLNITKAAEQLSYSQPAVTLQIRTLEKQIGSPLFVRVGRKMFLTPTGKVLKQHTDRLFSVLGELEEDLRKIDHPSGTLVIAGPDFYCTHYLSSILSSFVELHPQIKLKLISCNSMEAAHLIHSNNADIGIIAGVCRLTEVENTIIGSEDMFLVASPKIVEGQDASYTLNRHPFLMDTNVASLVNSFLPEINYTPQSIIECTSESAIKHAVLNQAGVCALGGAIIEEEIKSGELTVLHHFSEKLVTSLISLKSRSQEVAIRTFAELVKDGWGS